MSFRWEKLSPAEFQQLQDFATYSTKKLQDVLDEFNGTGPLSKYNRDGEIDYEGFKLFMNTWLEVKVPEDLCHHLFLSFIKKHHASTPTDSARTIKSGRAARRPWQGNAVDTMLGDTMLDDTMLDDTMLGDTTGSSLAFTVHSDG
ncbi:unnamed protein product [Darwinula stevensoni]|uniref:Diacylglycerol kinase type I N-terminal domain-containing protein n=1 Tax=Darwinula stevensoni TaxID=69355 RepID=A0A7R8X7D5_9CRUS|nr:unnamed protein product [Darwinula stevensoni]CAG0889043.1 unnamed protein product [Darwinula stevensoni]